MNPSNPLPTPPAGPNVPQQVSAGQAPLTPPQVTVPAAAPWLEPPVPVQPTSTAPPSDPQLYVAAPAVADDGDLIEKEWVQGAKQIVESTRMDPHQQTKKMHAFKAEYMKKRYNKVIEPVEE